MSMTLKQLEAEVKKLKKQVEEIAQIKMPDLNTDDLDMAKLQVAGTARSMGIKVV